MKFLINVLPNNSFNSQNINDFINNIKSQSFQNIQLIFKKDDSLNEILIDQIQSSYEDSLIVNNYNEVQLDSLEDNYWINLNVTDCLLPNAILQWAQMIIKHPNSTFELSYLNNEQSLSEQINAYLLKVQNRHPAHLDTIKEMIGLNYSDVSEDMSISQKLNCLLGFQRYSIRDTLNRFKVFNNAMVGKNILYKCSNDLLNEYDPSSISLIIKLLVESNEIIKLIMPTLILSNFSLLNRLQWLNGLDIGKKFIGDENVNNMFLNCYHSHVQLAQKQIKSANISSKLKKELSNQIKSSENN